LTQTTLQNSGWVKKICRSLEKASDRWVGGGRLQKSVSQILHGKKEGKE